MERRAANPYLREFLHRSRAGGAYAEWLRGQAAYWRRVACVRRYAFGVPDEAALATIARWAPIVELGAGTGYWASLLRARGVDVVAYDIAPPDVAANIHRFEPRTWTAVLRGGIDVLGGHSDRALFLCWPGYGDPFANAALAAYGGSTLVYVGEPRGGHTADEAFFDRLERDWRLRERVAIPRWPGTRDDLTVYTKAVRLVRSDR